MYQRILERFPDHQDEIARLYKSLGEVGREEDWVRSVLDPHTTLLVIDMQNDFVSGSLAVTGADELLGPMSAMITDDVWDQIIFSKDWHPADHISFFSNVNLRELDPDWLAEHPGDIELYDEVVFKRDPPYHQVLWPEHCVQESEGIKHDRKTIIILGSFLVRFRHS